MQGGDAPLAGGVLRDFTPREGEITLGRPTNPPCVPPGGAPAAEGGGTKGDAPPKPQAPQPTEYVLSMKGPDAPLGAASGGGGGFHSEDGNFPNDAPPRAADNDDLSLRGTQGGGGATRTQRTRTARTAQVGSSERVVGASADRSSPFTTIGARATTTPSCTRRPRRQRRPPGSPPPGVGAAAAVSDARAVATVAILRRHQVTQLR